MFGTSMRFSVTENAQRQEGGVWRMGSEEVCEGPQISTRLHWLEWPELTL